MDPDTRNHTLSVTHESSCRESSSGISVATYETWLISREFSVFYGSIFPTGSCLNPRCSLRLNHRRLVLRYSKDDEGFALREARGCDPNRHLFLIRDAHLPEHTLSWCLSIAMFLRRYLSGNSSVTSCFSSEFSQLSCWTSSLVACRKASRAAPPSRHP